MAEREVRHRKLTEDHSVEITDRDLSDHDAGKRVSQGYRFDRCGPGRNRDAIPVRAGASEPHWPGCSFGSYLPGRCGLIAAPHLTPEETDDGPLRTEDVHAAGRRNGRSRQALPGDWFSSTPERWARQEARRLLPGRHRDDQSACPSLEVR